ncbi:MAG: hypothetical protein HQL55_14160 [Magnetococcales bacterium]|nr:hypothetical protein [Magnetococcales bacterium]
MDQSLTTMGSAFFEELKRFNQYGAEYWSARDLQLLLGYSQWRRFEQAIERAVTSCRESGNNPDHHFAGVGKMVELGSGSIREVPDFHLSRFACYLIAQNGDPRKPEIAEAQKYFAVQTRRQELSDHLLADQERLELRHQASEEFKALSNAARQAGVQSRMFGIFHDAEKPQAGTDQPACRWTVGGKGDEKQGGLIGYLLPFPPGYPGWTPRWKMPTILPTPAKWSPMDRATQHHSLHCF